MLRNQMSDNKNKENEYNLSLLVNELRQSSDDLTRYCRTYVITGDTIWRNRYWEALDVRNGLKPRPDGSKIPLKELIRQYPITDAEMEKLNTAEDNSNALVYTERVAFNAMTGLFDDGTGQFTVKGPPDPELARTVMFDKKYNADIKSIMDPIKDFSNLLNQSIINSDRQFYTRSILLLGLNIGFILVVILILLLMFIRINRLIRDLAKEELNYRLLFEKSPLGIYQTTPEGKIINANNALVEMLGYDSLSELKEIDVINGYSKDSEINHDKFVKMIEKERHVKGVEEQWRTKKGNTIYIRENASLIYEPENKIRFYSGVVENITEYKEIEKTLRESEERYRNLIENTHDLVQSIDKDGKFIFVNTSWKNIMGYSDPEIETLSLFDIIHPESLDHCREILGRILNGEPIFSMEVTFIKKNGDRIILEGNAMPRKIDNEVIGTQSFFRDITERKRREKINEAYVHLIRFSDTHTANELLQECVNKAVELSDSRTGFYISLGDDQKTATNIVGSESVEINCLKKIREGFLPGPGDYRLWDYCFSKHVPVVYNDFKSIPDRPELPDCHPDIIREVVIPVIRADKVTALLVIMNKAEEYSEIDVSSLTVFADLTWEVANREITREKIQEDQESLLEAQKIGNYGYLTYNFITGKAICSENYYRLFGYKPYEFEPSLDTFRERVHPEDINLVDETMEKLQRSKEMGTLELRVERKDGSYGWYSMKLLPEVNNRRLVFLRGTIQDITASKETSLALLRSEEQFRRVILNNPSPILIIQNGQIIFFNSVVMKFSGYSQKELSGMPFLELIHPDRRTLLEKIIRNQRIVERFARQSESGRFEFQYLTKNGKIRWLAFTHQLITFENKPSIVVTGLDITDIKKAEEELQSSREQYALAVEGSNDGIWDWDILSNDIYYSPRCKSMFGYKDEELKNDPTTLESLIHPNDRDHNNKSLKDYLEGKKTVYDVEIRMRHKNGEYMWIRIKGKALRDKNGKPYRMAGSQTDITKLLQVQEEIKRINKDLEKRVEERSEELRRSEENLRLLANNSSDIIWTMNLDANFTYLSPAVEKLTGFTPEEYLAKALPEIIAPESLIVAFSELSVLQEAAEAGEPYTTKENFELEHIRKDGSTFWADIKASLMYDKEGKPRGIMGVSRDITNERKAKEALLDSETRFRDIALSMSDFVWEVDTKGRYTYSSGKVTDALGYSSEEIIGKTFFEFIAARERKPVQDFFKAVAVNKKPIIDLETVNVTKDGKEVIFLINGVPILDKKGDLVGYRGIDKDITIQKNADNKLRELTEAVEQSKTTVVITDIDGNIQYVNPAFTKLTGYTYNEAFGQNPRILNAGIHPPEYYKNLWDTILSGESWSNEICNKKKNGEIFWESATISPIIDDKDGTITSFIAIKENITERKKAEQELRKLYKAIEESNVSFIVTNNAGNIEYANPYYFQSTGFTRDEVIGNSPSIVKSGYHTDEFFIDLWDTILEGNVWHGEICNKKKSGELFWERVTISPIKDSEGEILNFVSIQGDITELRRLQEELKKAKETAEYASRSKSEFLANMSHEIRTPLNAILGYSELLGNTAENGTQKSHIESIKSSGRSLLTLINDILDLSKVEAGKLELSPEYIDSRFFFSEFRQIFSQKIAEKKLNFNLEISPDLPASLFIDEARLRQILFNLLGNALKFTEKGYVKLKADMKEPVIYDGIANENEKYGDLFIEVEDTGIGISKKLRKELYKPFVQEETRITRKYGGTGLGLAITLRIVQLMSGTIKVDSTEGKGTKFRIVIPQVKYSSELKKQIREEDIDPEGIIFDKAILLVADDVRHNRKYIKDILAGSDITVIEAENGRSAYELAKKNVPDIIITDIRMPSMNGFELLKKLKADDSLQHIPVIAYSASVMKSQIERINRSKFSGLLIKPVSIKKFYGVLLNHLKYRLVKSMDVIGSETEIYVSENVENLPELISLLDTTYKGIWESFEKRQPLNEIKNFGRQLTETGVKHNAKIISDYGNALFDAAEDIDIEKIINLIGKFPEMVEKIKSL